MSSDFSRTSWRYLREPTATTRRRKVNRPRGETAIIKGDWTAMPSILADLFAPTPNGERKTASALPRHSVGPKRPEGINREKGTPFQAVLGGMEALIVETFSPMGQWFGLHQLDKSL